MSENKKYWIVSREYAGLSEAGGVKNVTTSLATGFNKQGWDVTVFIPLYGCTAITNVDNFDIIENGFVEINVNSKKHRVVFAQGYFHGIKIVFIVNTCFTSKMGVYTYTRLEEALNPQLKSGEGHFDSSELSVLFQKSVIAFGELYKTAPEIFHCQDAHTALIPFIVHSDRNSKKHYKNTDFFITIHNAGCAYRNQIESSFLASKLLDIPESQFVDSCVQNRVEPFLLSQHYAHFTTVSPWYADELLQPENEFCGDICKEFAKRKFKIIGITNGIDSAHYDPTNKKISTLPFEYNPEIGDLEGKYKCREDFIQKYREIHTCTEEKKVDRIFQHGIVLKESREEEPPVYFSFHGRLVHQKGIDVLVEAAEIVLTKRSNARFVVMGQGSKELEKCNIELSERFKGKYLFFQGYDKALSRLCIAISDFLVLPSFFEPCGLEDFIGQIYGTVPIAHACGGLNKIIHEKTGFLYYQNDALTLSNVLIDLLDKRMREEDMFLDIIKESAQYVKKEFAWNTIISEKYIPLFK